MKRILLIGIAATITLCTALGAAALSPTEPQNWYFVPSKQDGQPPRFDVDVNSLKQYGAYCIGDPAQKKIYLTFDAGYDNGNVTQTVDILDRHNVKGAFFVLDNFIIKNPELVKKMAAGGHLVCNHTLKHRDMTRITDFEQFKQQITPLEELYASLTGKQMPKFYRPPEGKYTIQNLEYMQKLGYKTIFWSMAHADWDENKQPDPEKAYVKLINRTHPGMVLLLHPTSSTNVKILEDLIAKWTQQGYTFGTLDELSA